MTVYYKTNKVAYYITYYTECIKFCACVMGIELEHGISYLISSNLTSVKAITEGLIGFVEEKWNITNSILLNISKC